MNSNSWFFFSFSVPSRLQAFRVKIWRKLGALGAVQIKNAVYVLPADDHHQEQLTWMAKETEEHGGEALIIAHGRLLTLSDAQVRAAFARARDNDYRELEEEIRAHLGQADPHDLPAVLRRFGRRLEAIRAIDFHPSGKGEVLTRLLDSAKQDRGSQAEPLPALDPAGYQGKTWVTRTNPYVDRLASFWLVRRFIDPEAKVAFVPEHAAAPPTPGQVLFDMAEADFTHARGLITFEVLAESFRLTGAVPERMRRVLRAIDLEESDDAPAEAAGVKRMLDGLVATNADDRACMEAALAFFDTLLASYGAGRKGQAT